MRLAEEVRTTKETNIQCKVNLDGSGQAAIATGIGFFDHMLTLLAFHSGFDITMQAKGDLEVCDHGSMNLPMDETLANVSLDISGRSYLVYHCELKRDTIGTFSCEMVEEFLRAFAFQAGITLHVNVFYGTNDHHKVEAIFKALGRALGQATQVIGDALPSTKGMLE